MEVGIILIGVIEKKYCLKQIESKIRILMILPLTAQKEVRYVIENTFIIL